MGPLKLVVRVNESSNIYLNISKLFSYYEYISAWLFHKRNQAFQIAITQ